MARKHQRKLWGVLLAVACFALPAVLYFSTQTIAQNPAPTKIAVLKKFVEATDLYKKGEYEKAKVLFDFVKANNNLLTPAQVRDLEAWIRFNDLALQGRQRYAEVLILTEKAIKERRYDDARRFLKELDANPYPTPPQRDKKRELECLLNDCFNPQTYRDHLKLAHLAFDNGELDFAEEQCRISISKRGIIHPFDWPDTPEKLLERINAARHPNAENKGFFNFIPWFRKETPAPKDNGPAPKITNFDGNQPQLPGSGPPPPGAGAPPMTPPQQPQIQPAPEQPQSPPQYQQSLPLPPQSLPLPPPLPPQSLNGPYPAQPAGTVRMSEQDLPPSNILQTAAVEDPQVAELRRQAIDYMRDALHNLNDLNDLGKAREYADKARAMNVKFPANDPNNPERLLEEIYRREEGMRIAAGGKPGEGPRPTSTRPRDPRTLLKQARELIKKEQWDEAQRLIALATEAASLTRVTWGLFEDTPDKVQRDLNDKRAARHKEKAVLLMLKARKEFNEKNYAEAKELALEAKELHGPYTLWDTMKGERAQNLIDEITRLEDKLKTRFVAEKKDIKAPEEAPVSDVQLQQDIARRNQCLALMDDARGLSKSGDLIGARAKLVEAQKLNVIFVPGDQNPAGMLADLQWDCQEALNRGLKESGALLNNASDSGRFQKAMLKLNETMQLCSAFGLNPVPIQQSIAYVLQVQNLTPPAPPELTPMQKEGKVLLDQANFELQKGNLGEARALAERAFEKKYSLQGWAEQMLRSIDSAQHQVARRTANDNARSLVDAFRRKDYRQTAAIFKQLDARLIEPNLLDQVREIMSRGEVQTELRPREGGFATANDEPKEMPKLPSNAGRSSVTDGPPLANDSLKEIRVMEKVQFDYWRKESINVQQTAIEVCKTDPAGAISRLEEFLAKLTATKFNPNDQDALMKPIENRINQYKKLQADSEWLKKQEQQATKRRLPGDTSVEEQQQTERALQDTYMDIKARINKAAKLMKENKFEEALKEYKICRNLLPNDPAVIKPAIIGIEMATKKLLEKEWNDNKNQTSGIFGKALINKYVPEGVTDPDNFQFTPNDFYQKRPSIGAKGYPGAPPSRDVREIEAKLNEPVSVDLSDATLNETIRYLRSISGLNISVDTMALKKEGIGLDQRLTEHLETVQLKSVLNILLRQLQLTYVIRDNVVVITTERASVGNVVTRVYPIADLVVPIPDYVTDTFDSLHDAFRRHVAGNYQSVPPSPMTAPYGTPPGQVVSNGYPYSPTGQTAGGHVGDHPPPAGPELARTLIGVITDCVAQNSWANQGGHGNINFYPLGNALIVNQTENVHEHINYLLTNLRKMQEVQVAIEMRVLTLSDQWYDLVNMNFEAGNISNFAQGPQQIRGIAPAGTSPDMNIPFKNVVDQFTGPVGIGVSNGSVAIGAGFSFLNEIQVHMFMEAARADKRTQFLQNPKIAVMSGQTAKLAFNKHRFFNTSATPIQNGAQVFFMPQNNPFPIGITMQVTPIVSADRRFVRLHLVPNITNLVSNNIPQIPVEIPVPQIFDGRGDPGRASVVKMFFQQPEFETVSLNTTVNVPDGSTVMLGGLKTMAEVRYETGAPVLSNLPSPFNRLFRNMSTTRDARSLMIMVTPRIIINESEADYSPQLPNMSMPNMPQAAYQR